MRWLITTRAIKWCNISVQPILVYFRVKYKSTVILSSEPYVSDVVESDCFDVSYDSHGEDSSSFPSLAPCCSCLIYRSIRVQYIIDANKEVSHLVQQKYIHLESFEKNIVS